MLNFTGSMNHYKYHGIRWAKTNANQFSVYQSAQYHFLQEPSKEDALNPIKIKNKACQSICIQPDIVNTIKQLI